MGSFANHSSKPNAKKVRTGDAIVLEAVQKIKVGEEVTIDYGPAGSESYKVAMGTGRYVVSTRQDGSGESISFRPLYINGEVIKVSATTADAALNILAGDLCAEVVSPSAGNQGCFLRCIAILLSDLLSSHQKLRTTHHMETAKAFLDGVDVASLRKGEPDYAGLQKMRNHISDFVRQLVHSWDNVFDPTEAGEATFGDVLTNVAQEDIPDLLEQVQTFRREQSSNATEEVPQKGTEAAKQETKRLLDIVAKSLSGRTADSGSLSTLVTALMLGVDVHVYSVNR